MIPIISFPVNVDVDTFCQRGLLPQNICTEIMKFKKTGTVEKQNSYKRILYKRILEFRIRETTVSCINGS